MIKFTGGYHTFIVAFSRFFIIMAAFLATSYFYEEREPTANLLMALLAYVCLHDIKEKK